MTSSPSPDHRKIVELDASKVQNAPGNRAVTQEAVGLLLPSIEKDGQIIPGICYPHPTIPDAWLCADGCHRLAACRWLGRAFKAILLPSAPSQDELSRLRVAVNFLAKRASAYELGPEIQGWLDRNGGSQKAAAEFFRLSESTISKMLNKWRNAVPEVVQAEKDKLICEDGGRLLATLAKDRQGPALQHVIANKLGRDQIECYVSTLKGFNRPKAKPVMAKEGGATLTFPAEWTFQRLIEFAQRIQEAAKTGLKVPGVTVTAIQGLLKPAQP